ncbi:DNA alkylation repair protein [Enterococcus silesiacus]|uniref:DNA alkylation repair protein n=1 Tax=Enterococcus silesiacus TaxID=332949 RepID=A0A0S3K9X5_9ENTE|nr:DNA alkylation repair protein [Enterococcus silesiacus]ALS01028.1 DNA alkylation repair protein [Enterococcus silesiacus]OJG91748.1 hypothetical protein RV15_GL000415 [Enterococcus silesiacus]
MNIEQVMSRLEELGTEQTKKTLRKYGATEPFYGVKIGDLKKYLVKEVKKDQNLALALFDTGNSDAQYLAGLSIRPKQLTKEQLQDWAKKSHWSAISEAIVASVAAESPFAVELAQEWLKSTDELIEDTGWCCYGKYISIAPNDQIDYEEVANLLNIVKETIHHSPKSVRYCMNQFVIYVGAHYLPLLDEAQKTAEAIGVVTGSFGDISCNIPLASDAIHKSLDSGRNGLKKKRAVC